MQQDFQLLCMQSHDYTAQLSPDIYTDIYVKHLIRAVSYELTSFRKYLRAEQTEIQSREKWNVLSSDSYLDMSPQYHSASCSEPLAASFTPLPFTGVMGFVGLGGRAAKEMREIFLSWKIF